MDNNQIKIITFVGIGGVALGFLSAWLVFGVWLHPVSALPVIPHAISSATSSNPASNIGIKNTTTTIIGDSMGKILKDGQVVTVLQNYYNSNPVMRGDLVAYNYPGSLVVRKVFGLPGDRMALRQAKDGWNVLINGEILVNAAGEKYHLIDSGKQMLSLYIKNLDGVIPEDGYLIFGDSATGSNDSSRFGLVSKGDFLGKVQLQTK